MSLLELMTMSPGFRIFIGAAGIFAVLYLFWHLLGD